MRVQLLEEKPLEAVARTEVREHRPGVDPRAGLQQGAQPARVAPVAARLPDAAALPARVRRLMHVEMAVEIEKCLLHPFPLVPFHLLEKPLPELAESWKEASRIWRGRQFGRQVEQADQVPPLLLCAVVVGEQGLEAFHPEALHDL